MAERATAVEDKRRILLDAAVRVFARKGFHASRVGDIAAEAGVAHGLLYHYFSSKDELLTTIFHETWGAMLDRFHEVEESEVPAREQLRRVAAVVLRTWRRDPELVRVLVREVTRSPHIGEEIGEIANAFKSVERIIARGQNAGDLRDGIEPRLAAVIFYGALEEILTSWVLGQLPGGDNDIAQAERAVTEVFTAGLARHRVAATL